MKKFFVIFLTASLFLTETRTMEQEMPEVHDYEEPITGEQLERADLMQLAEIEDLSFRWSDFPEEIKMLVLLHLANDKDSAQALKAIKNLELVDHATHALVQDNVITRPAYSNFILQNKENLQNYFVKAAGCNDLSSVKMFLEFLEESTTVNGRNNKGETAVMASARQKRLKLVKFLLNRGADVTLYDNFTNSVLLHACFSRDEDIIRLILSEGGFCLNDRSTAGPDTSLNQLFASVILGETQRVKRLINKKVDLNTYDTNKMTPIMFAACCGYLDIVELLIMRGADVNAQDRWGQTALIRASKNGYIDIVNLLISSGANVDIQTGVGLTALMRASESGHTNIAKILIASGANVNLKTTENGYTALHMAAESSHEHVVYLLTCNGADPNIQSNHKVTPLMLAAVEGDANITNMLIQSGADIDAQEAKGGYSALMFAAYNGHIDEVCLLIQNGANANLKDNNGETAFLKALRKDYKEIFTFLTQYSDEVNVQETQYGYTPLMWACYRGDRNLVNDLIQRHASVNDKDKKGNTALMWAAYNGHKDIVILLLENRADITIANIAQATALDIAREQGHLEIVSLLENYQVD